MGKLTQINTKTVVKVPTKGNDVTTLGTNSVATNNIQDGAVTFDKLDPNARFSAFAQAGFQNFVDTQNQLIATTTPGTPATGYFYSSIIGRKPIVDLTQDLRPRIGIERIMTLQLNNSPLLDETGPNGETVYGVLNDTSNRIRLVGSWFNAVDSYGPEVFTTTASNYVEVTFYGTGLNVLSGSPITRDWRPTVDGGTEGSALTMSTIDLLGNRNYGANVIVPVVSGLTLGVHTVKIRYVSGGSLLISGFEIVTEATTLKVNPGYGYSTGKRIPLTSQQSPAYASGFTNTYGTPGTRGGRVVVYLDTDGSIKKDIRYTNTASATLSSADHTNEEVARVYHWREFGASRFSAGDDFSLLTGASGSGKAFTLDDGTTTLLASLPQVDSSTGALRTQSNGQSITITFIGTGLDIVQQDAGTGGADSYTVQVDGAAGVAMPSAGSSVKRITKIVSGLPYGTHTVRFNRVTAATWDLGIHQFIVYQPKTPTISSSAILLGSYNLMADFSPNATAGQLTISGGVIRKENTREFIYQTTWNALSLDTNQPGGFVTYTTTDSQFTQYTFWGTAFSFRFYSTATSTTFQISLNGSTNLSGYTTSSFGSGVSSFTAATGTVITSTTGNTGNGVNVSGLPLGLYTVRFTKIGGTGQFGPQGIEFCTPVHSHKSNIYADLQNTLPVGSNSLEDSRKLTPVKDVLPGQKAWAQAVGITSNPTTTSTSAVPVPDLSCTIQTTGGALEVSFLLGVIISAANGLADAFVRVDGQSYGVISYFQAYANGVYGELSQNLVIPISAGVHKVEVVWFNSGTAATITAETVNRILTVRER